MITKALQAVVAERTRQVLFKGFPSEKDDRYEPGVLATAGACYLAEAFAPDKLPPATFPFSRDWWKPAAPYRNIVKGLALGLAELERMDRAQGGDMAATKALWGLFSRDGVAQEAVCSSRSSARRLSEGHTAVKRFEAIYLDGEWWVPLSKVQTVAPSAEDLRQDDHRRKVEAAVAKAKAAGLTDDEIKAIREGGKC